MALKIVLHLHLLPAGGLLAASAAQHCGEFLQLHSTRGHGGGEPDDGSGRAAVATCAGGSPHLHWRVAGDSRPQSDLTYQIIWFFLYFFYFAATIILD